MKYKGNIHFFLLCLLLLSNVACKTISVQQERQVATTHQLYLGSIGTQKTSAFQSNFKIKTTPYFDSKIRLDAKILSFSKQTYKAYQTAQAYQGDSVLKIEYHDTVAKKPQFIKLTIANELNLIETLNGEVNKEVNAFIKINNDAGIITDLSVAMDAQRLKIFKQADEVFLISSDLGTPKLALYKNDTLSQTIRFNDLVSFAHKTSNFCWQQDEKYNIQIVAISKGSSCPKSTYSSAKRAKKEIDYFKF